MLLLFLLNISQPIDICHLKIPQTAKELRKICTNIQQLDFGVSRGFLQGLNLCRLQTSQTSKVSRSYCVTGKCYAKFDPHHSILLIYLQSAFSLSITVRSKDIKGRRFNLTRRARLAHRPALLDSLDSITSKMKCCFKCSTILSIIMSWSWLDTSPRNQIDLKRGSHSLYPCISPPRPIGQHCYSLIFSSLHYGVRWS